MCLNSGDLSIMRVKMVRILIPSVSVTYFRCPNLKLLLLLLLFLFFFLFRGHAFRKKFSNLGEIRSIVPESVNLMALTANGTVSTRNFIIKNLSMRNPAIVYVPPFKGNIIYFVLDKPKGIHEAFRPIVTRLITDRNMGRVIIFCRTHQDTIAIHIFFLHALGEYSTEPKGSPNYVVNRVFDILSLHTSFCKGENFETVRYRIAFTFNYCYKCIWNRD